MYTKKKIRIITAIYFVVFALSFLLTAIGTSPRVYSYESGRINNALINISNEYDLGETYTSWIEVDANGRDYHQVVSGILPEDMPKIKIGELNDLFNFKNGCVSFTAGKVYVCMYRDVTIVGYNLKAWKTETHGSFIFSEVNPLKRDIAIREALIVFFTRGFLPLNSFAGNSFTVLLIFAIETPVFVLAVICVSLSSSKKRTAKLNNLAGGNDAG